MRITHFTKNTFGNHYLSVATLDRILLESARQKTNKLEKQDNGKSVVKSKHFTPLEKKVTLPKI